MKYWFIEIVKIIFLPFVLMWDLFMSKRSTLAKCFYAISIIIFLGSTWIGAASGLIGFFKYNLFQWGVTNRITSINVVGTSMLPTIHSGDVVSLDSPRKFTPEKGDIVSFQNVETGAYSYIKRVIGAPGDTVSIRNGHVILNGTPLNESYTYNNLPTYGNTFLGECEPAIVPADSYFVLGDNRTVSMDSRILGFVSRSDITGVIKTHQTLTSDSATNETSKTNIDKDNFIKMLNEKRKFEKHDALFNSVELSRIAQRRSEQIRDNYEEWKTETSGLDTLLENEQYGYNLVHEYVTFGYLDEKAVIDQIFESFVEKEYFVSEKYMEVGMGVAEREFNGCSYPIITVVISWPTKPTYDQSVIDFWQRQDDITSSLLNKLNTYLSRPDQDQKTVRLIIDKTANMSETASRIEDKMKKGEWLTTKDNRDIKSYNNNVKEVQSLIKESFTSDAAEEILSYIDTIAVTDFSKSTARARDHFAAGEYKEGLTEAEKSLTLAKGKEEEAISHYWVGLMNYKLNNPEKAETELQMAIQLKKDYAAPYVTLSALRMDKGDFQEAYDMAKLAVKYDPNYAWAHNDLGLALAGLGRKSEAIQELKKAVELSPDSYVFRDNLTRVSQSN